MKTQNLNSTWFGLREIFNNVKSWFMEKIRSVFTPRNSLAIHSPLASAPPDVENRIVTIRRTSTTNRPIQYGFARNYFSEPLPKDFLIRFKDKSFDVSDYLLYLEEKAILKENGSQKIEYRFL